MSTIRDFSRALYCSNSLKLTSAGRGSDEYDEAALIGRKQRVSDAVARIDSAVSILRESFMIGLQGDPSAGKPGLG